ncbi:MAG TPA: PQQ-binding-like beta-propeller repeat protein [Verrucomicrobiae bacterium]|nr:PQQ-binding-like beta-propeller repeat protein [Verrucomicrobiae bacterium]
MKTSTQRKFGWVIALTLLTAAPHVGAASDWPTYRADGSRSGYTADALPADLSPRWTYRPRHAPQPAWPGRDTRMPFDRAFHAVIAGDTLLFGSSADGKVMALNAATGEELWSFLAAGPVRFAPAIYRDRAFVVSDDGFLYCLATRDGKMLWRIRGGDGASMVLGNGRLISRWPARGGPVIADGIVYWAAGIWPSEGVFIHAVDAADGRVIWRNTTAAGMLMPQPHPGAVAQSGVSAQGDLVVVGDRLLVPTGRGVPAAFSRADGKFLFFHLQTFGKVGGSGIVATDSQFFNGACAFDLATGKQACLTGSNAMVMAVAPDSLLLATTNEIAAIDRANPWRERKVADPKTKKMIGQRVLNTPIWRMANPISPPSCLIVAGDKAVVGGGGGIAVADIPSRQILLTKKTDGEAVGLAASNGRLFVSTATGAIQCFDGSHAAAPKNISPPPATPATPAAADAAADEIIQKTGITEGYCLDAACGDGSLAIALAKKTRLHICAMNPDPGEVAAIQRRLDAAGLLGTRITTHLAVPPCQNLPSYFANLVVAGRSVDGAADVVSSELINRVLRPFGGKSCIGKPGLMQTATRGDLAGAGAWTHQYCDAANTCCSSDSLLRGPLGICWFNDLEFTMPSRHGRGPAPLFYRGLLFIEGLNALRCVDAYNGRPLWEYPLPEILQPYDGEHLMGVSGTGSNICVGERGLFIRTEKQCLRLDPETGKLLGRLSAPPHPDGRPGEWGMIACAGDTIIGSLADTGHVVTYRYRPGDMQEQWTESSLLFAIDAVTGEVKWTWRPQNSIRHNAIAIGGGRAYVIDRPIALADRTKEKKRSVPDPGFVHPDGRLIALDLATGRVAWESTEEIFGTLLALSEEYKTLLMCFQDSKFKLVSEIGGRMAAFDIATGQRRWDIKASYSTRPVLHGRTVLFQSRGWDIVTGQAQGLAFPRSYGCGIPSASRHLMAFRSATLGYVDLEQPQNTRSFGGIRPGCWINAVPAGGLLLMPDATDRCTCSYLIKTSIALQPMSE